MNGFEIAGYEFQAWTFDCLATGSRSIPNRAAIYCFLVRSTGVAIDLFAHVRPKLIVVAGEEFYPLYIGESYAARSRMEEHVFGEDISSGFRSTLRAISLQTGCFTGCSIGSEASWLEQYTIAATCEPEYICIAEKQVIETTGSLLNIKGNDRAHAKWLRALRRQMREEAAMPPGG